MNNSLIPAQALSTVPVVTDEQLDLIKRTVANGATNAELQLYLYDCQRHGVHPLDRLLHFTKRDNKYTPITSIDLLRSRAADTGQLAGITDATFTGGFDTDDFQATVTVYRMVDGQRCPFTATARWAEYYPGDGKSGFMWRKMPFGQLGKCAEALALRKAFPRQLAQLYVGEEMDQAGPINDQASTVNQDTGEIIETVAQKKRPPSREAILQRIQKRLKEAQDVGLDMTVMPVLDELSDADLMTFGKELAESISTQRANMASYEPPMAPEPVSEEASASA